MKLENIFTKMPFLETDRLVLKKIEDEDYQDLFEIYDNDKVFEFCGILPKHNVETVKNMINHFERDYNKKSRMKLGIFIKGDSQKMVGIIEAMDFKKKIDSVTIGYYLSEEYWGKGIATEALLVLIKFLFEVADMNRIQAEVMTHNEASKQVLSNNNFIKEGTLRQAAFWAGKGIIDYEIYSILRTEYDT